MGRAFNLRGTNGAGKTHVARHLLQCSMAKPHTKRGKKIATYKGDLYGQDFIIFGSYETNCGGCDTIPSVHIVAEMLDKYLALPNTLIFYEGLMISHMIGTVGATVKMHPKWLHTMGFLDTPLETCIARVQQRRLDQGNTKPFDPERTLVKDYKAVRRARENAIDQDFHVVDVRHDHAVVDVLTYLRKLSDLR